MATAKDILAIKGSLVASVHPDVTVYEAAVKMNEQRIGALVVMEDVRPGPEPADGPSVVTFDIEPYHEIVRLTVTHENLADHAALEAISAGWPAVFANLKSLLETGHVLPRAPWEMHAELRAAQMAARD